MMMHKLREMISQRARDERGFTLVELLMVMVIIGVLAGLGFTGFNALQRRTAVTQADVYWRDLNMAASMHKVEYGSYPSQLTDGNQAEPKKGTLFGYLDTDTMPWVDADKVEIPIEAGEINAERVQYGFGTDHVCVWVNGYGSGQNDGCVKNPGSGS